MDKKAREKIDQKALAGIHRVIPAFKEDCGGEPIDAYLTSASIKKILDRIFPLLEELGWKPPKEKPPFSLGFVDE